MPGRCHRLHEGGQARRRSRGPRAPNAIGAADRWRLLQTLGAAVEEACQRHRPCLREQAGQDAPAEGPVVVLPMSVLPGTPVVERTCDQHRDVHRMLDRGWTISAIARRLRLDRC